MIMFHASSKFPELKSMFKLKPWYSKNRSLPFSNEPGMYTDTHYVATRGM